MSVKVRIPVPLRRLSKGESEVEVPANTLSAVLTSLNDRFPGFRERICDEGGQMRRFMNVYVNGEDIRFLQGLSAPLRAGDEVAIVPAAVGGQVSPDSPGVGITPSSFSVSITAEARSGGRVLLACLTRGQRDASAGKLAQAVEWRSEPREVAEGELEEAVRTLAHQALGRVRDLLGMLQLDRSERQV